MAWTCGGTNSICNTGLLISVVLVLQRGRTADVSNFDKRLNGQTAGSDHLINSEVCEDTHAL